MRSSQRICRTLTVGPRYLLTVLSSNCSTDKQHSGLSNWNVRTASHLKFSPLLEPASSSANLSSCCFVLKRLMFLLNVLRRQLCFFFGKLRWNKEQLKNVSLPSFAAQNTSTILMAPLSLSISAVVHFLRQQDNAKSSLTGEITSLTHKCCYQFYRKKEVDRVAQRV